MSLFEKPKLSEPNEMGFQFGVEESLTKYAHERQEQVGDSYMPSLNVTILEVWKGDNRVAYLLVDEATNQPIREALNYEACACAIDAFKASKLADEIEAKEKEEED